MQNASSICFIRIPPTGNAAFDRLYGTREVVGVGIAIKLHVPWRVGAVLQGYQSNRRALCSVTGAEPETMPKVLCNPASPDSVAKQQTPLNGKSHSSRSLSKQRAKQIRATRRRLTLKHLFLDGAEEG